MKSLLAGGFAGIYTGDQQALDKANKALALKRELMLMSPDVNVDKMLTVKIQSWRTGQFCRSRKPGYPAEQLVES